MSDQTISLRIAVVGVEGSGKTVLLTTLASRQNNPSNGELLLVPNNFHVLKYVNRNWGKLQSGQWPDSTPQSEWQAMQWTLKTPNGHLATLDTVDMAGHDVRRVFANSLDETIADDLDDAARNVRDTILAADCIYLVFNLKNTASLNFEKRTDDEAVLLNIFQHVVKNGKSVTFILTQWSDCEEWVNAKGGARQVLQSLLPNLYSAIVLCGNNINFFVASAVVDTETKVSDDGNCYQVPRIGFSSLGIDTFSSHLSNFIEEKAQEYAKLVAKKQAYKKVNEAEDTGRNIGFYIGVVLGVGGFFLFTIMNVDGIFAFFISISAYILSYEIGTWIGKRIGG